MSSNYANLAGILAGFSFSGIYLLIEYEKRDASEVISILLVGFFGLILSAFLFSNISRIPVDQENLVQMKELVFSVVVASIIFCISVIQMFVSLVFIFILYRLPKMVINLGKIIYYETAIITAMFITTTIPKLYLDRNIEDLTNDLFLTGLVFALFIFALSKILMRKLDIFFEKSFIKIVAGITLLMLILVGFYRSPIYLGEIPVIFPHVLNLIYILIIMINSFSINHEYRMMMLKDQQRIN
jgi:hypothetical protein